MPVRGMMVAGYRRLFADIGLMCTALEYDAVSINEATDAFWRLAQDRYLAYSFGEQPSPKQLLASVLALMPTLSREWPAMHAFAEHARQHPFQFKPFEPLSEDQVRTVLAHAQQAIYAYRPEQFALSHDVQQAPRAGWIKRIRRAVFRASATTAWRRSGGQSPCALLSAGRRSCRQEHTNNKSCRHLRRLRRSRASDGPRNCRMAPLMHCTAVTIALWRST